MRRVSRLGLSGAWTMGCLSVLACGKRETNSSAAPSPSFSVLVPMDTEPAAPPPLPVLAQPDPPPPRPPSPGSEPADLADDAGEARCPTPLGDASARAPRGASVRLEMVITAPKPSVELVIPALGLRERLWHVTADPLQNPNSCNTEFDTSARRLTFTCSEVMTSTSGKIYARTSDVILALTHHPMRGSETKRFELPCGTVPRFEAVQCPSRCEKLDESRCECTEFSNRWSHSPRSAPSPTPTGAR